MTYSIKGTEDDETEGSVGNRRFNNTKVRYAPEKALYNRKHYDTHRNTKTDR